MRKSRASSLRFRLLQEAPPFDSELGDRFSLQKGAGRWGAQMAGLVRLDGNQHGHKEINALGLMKRIQEGQRRDGRQDGKAPRSQAGEKHRPRGKANRTRYDEEVERDGEYRVRPFSKSANCIGKALKIGLHETETIAERPGVNQICRFLERRPALFVESYVQLVLGELIGERPSIKRR